MRKITFIISTLNSGGAERVISLISKSLSDYYNVSIILLLNGQPKAYDISEKVSIIELKNHKGRINKWFNIIRELHNVIKTEDSDVYISFCTIENIVSLIASFGTRKKLIISERNAPKTEKKPLLIKILQKILYPFSNYFVFQTDTAKKMYKKKIQQKSVVIPNPITENLPQWQGELKLENNYICAVGRLHPQKNYPLLFRSFSQFCKDYKDYQLLVFGTGEQEKELLDLINLLRMNEKIHLMGYHKDVHKYLKNCSFFVMTSDYEGMPNALMEAMSMGIPCISTDCPSGGPAKIIKNYENGILVNVNDQSSLISSMKYLVDNQDKAKSFGKKAKMIKDSYTINNITLEWKKTIDLIIHGD